MYNSDLTDRINRIYAAVEVAVENDISKLRAQVINSGSQMGLIQDWKGTRTDAELSNIVHSLVSNIANLRDNLKSWASQNGKDKKEVDKTFKNSLALKIIQDLNNSEKHGYPPKHSWSGKFPKLDKVNSIMQMTTKAEKGSFISVTMNRDGVPQVAGTGSAKVVITADILDKDGNKIGDLYKTALEALEAWEQLLGSFGLSL